LLARLKEALARRDLLAPRPDVDSIPIAARVRLANRVSIDLSPAEFAPQATKEGDLFLRRAILPAAGTTGEPARIQVSRSQDAAGRLLRSTVDPDARWRRPKPPQPVLWGDQENRSVDKAGFILARPVTRANAGDVEGAEPRLDGLPRPPKSRTDDAASGPGAFRQQLRRQGMTLEAPLQDSNQATESPLRATGAFPFPGDHLVCRAGHVLYPTDFPPCRWGPEVRGPAACVGDGLAAGDGPSAPTGAATAGRQPLPLRVPTGAAPERDGRLPAGDAPTQDGSRGRLRPARSSRGDQARLRGIDQVDCPGSVAPIAHNSLKALTKARFGKRAAAAK
jgi:hypothetical protein